MKLYFSPGACSMAPHIVLLEAGFSYELEKVDLAQGRTAAGEDYAKVNPKGYVPALRLDDGQILTEVPVVVQYLADLKPESGLAPRAGTLERYRLMEWLNFVSSEVHKQFGPLFRPEISADWKENQLNLLAKRFTYLDGHLNGRPYLMDSAFTAADAYLFTVLNWHRRLEVDLRKWPQLENYLVRVADRPAVKAAMKEEGLI